MAPSPLRNKTAALGRLIKDQKLYQEEASAQRKRVDQLKSENGDEYELKMAERVLADTEQMIPEVRKRIDQYLTSLKDLLNTDLDEDTTEAKAKVEEAEAFLASNSA